MLMLLNNAVTVAKYASYYVWAMIGTTWKWTHELLVSKRNAEPAQPIDYVPITKRNGVLETVANSVTGENWN